MNNTSLKVLLVEDNPSDALLVREMLAETRSVDCEVMHIDRLSRWDEVSDRSPFDVILVGDRRSPKEYKFRSLISKIQLIDEPTVSFSKIKHRLHEYGQGAFRR